MNLEEVERRIAELDAKIEAYPCWGAALTAMDEERRGLMDIRQMKKAFEWQGILEKTDEGTVRPCTLIVVAKTIEEARQIARSSPRYSDTPEAVDAPCSAIRILGQLMKEDGK